MVDTEEFYLAAGPLDSEMRQSLLLLVHGRVAFTARQFLCE